MLKRVEEEINSRDNINKAAEMFSDLNVVEKGLKKMTEMEWTGGKTSTTETIVNSDNDDDEQNVDPLKIIAQNRNIVKMVQVIKPEPSLITPADIEDIKSFEKEKENENGNESISSTNSIILEPHALYICTMDKSAEKNKKEKFLPHKTTTSNVHSIEKEKSRIEPANFENTAATPPKLRNNATKLLSLQDAFEIEQKQKAELKQMLEKQAVERLEARKKLVADNLSLLPPGSSMLDPNEFFGNYRTSNGYDSDSSYSENSYNGEDPETGGIIVQFD